MEERLRFILAIVTDHLKFAEAKNATLLAANAATVFAVLQVLLGDGKPQASVAIYLGMAGILSLLSGLVVLVSFLPQTHIPWLINRTQIQPTDSLLFFGDIQKYSPQAYLNALRLASGVDIPTAPSLEMIYAEQIVVNSRIAARKYTCFRLSIWLTLAGVLTPFPLPFLHLYIHDQHRSSR